MPLKNGQILNNKYRILGHINNDSEGERTFSSTYKAENIQSKQYVVIKTPKSGIHFHKRFLEKEIPILKRVSNNNEHIVSFLDDFFIDGQPYLVMQFIEGKTLEKYVQETRIELTNNQNFEEALEYIRQIGRALIKLHNQNPTIVHRDIKPDNIMLQKIQDPYDNKTKYKAILIDFGIAGRSDLIGIKPTNLGSGNYAPYEQKIPGECPYKQKFANECNMSVTEILDKNKCVDKHNLSTKCKLATYLKPTLDIYSLAATLYFVIKKEPPPDSISRSANDNLAKEIYKNIYLANQEQAKLYIALYKGMEFEADTRCQRMEDWINMLEPNSSINKWAFFISVAVNYVKKLFKYVKKLVKSI
ncbi:serine/threonine protein kinase [Nostoc sphaeroides CHAB 2801]|uniref:serine/threonine-protein kinase n=1 Tax=Nostoc sphaeroides TaxID=446679 RepID=UPI000E486A47|nr:serine/threonine-protein kinase [Nostoc sphaeroides]MCC5634064.1 serine/threonine protein kinase [Nostoc sphaeroides CHAB 2801]